MKTILSIFILISHVHASELKVQKLVWNDEKKMYEVYFDKSAGVHFADEKMYECLSYSLKNEKLAKIELAGKKLILKSCAKVESK